jgi:hypothetical protein
MTTADRARQHEHVRTLLHAHVEDASHEEMQELVDDLAEDVARRVGRFGPLVRTAVVGIRQAVMKHKGEAPPAPANLRTPPDTPVPPA